MTDLLSRGYLIVMLAQERPVYWTLEQIAEKTYPYYSGMIEMVSLGMFEDFLMN